MKTKPAKSPGAINLRKQAEAKLSIKKKNGVVDSQPSKDSKRLVHELEVHQIELEIQNEELKQTRAELETALDQFTDLYDFAPVGYFTLSRDGVIQRTNLAGTTLLGVERFRLVQKRMVAFVPAESYVVFNTFLQNVFSTLDKETCEISLLNSSRQKIWVQLEGLRIGKSETCRIAAMDITKRKLAEAEQAKLASIVNSSEDAIVGKTLDGIITSWNAGAQKLYGYTGQEAVGQSVAILVPKDRPDELPGILAQIRLGESVDHYETVRVRKDGVRLDVSVTVSPIFDEAGRVAAASSISRDVTRRKQAEDELKEREGRLRIANFDLERAQSVAHVGIWKWDLRTRAVEWSDEMYRIFGIDKDSYTGRLGDAISKLIHPDDLHIVLPSNAGQFASNKPQEYRVIRATDGSIRNIWAKSGESILDEQGTPIYLTGIAQDVTERKQAEEKLYESEARYHAISESANDAIISADEAGNIVDWNLGAENMFGYAESEACGQPLSLILPDRYIGEHQAAMERVKAGGEKHIIGKTVEREGRRKDNSEFPLEISVSEWQVGDKKYYSSIIRDITERKQADDMINKYANELEVRVEERTAELVHANRVKNEFLATMSHELRTPLNSILGFSETLLEGTRGTLTARQIEAVEYVSSSGRHLLELINDILDLSKIEANKFEIHPEIILVNDICRSSLSFIGQSAQKKKINVEFDRQPEASMILADPRRLKQILVNLLSNAIKFTPEMGTVRLEVRADSALGMM